MKQFVTRLSINLYTLICFIDKIRYTTLLPSPQHDAVQGYPFTPPPRAFTRQRLRAPVPLGRTATAHAAHTKHLAPLPFAGPPPLFQRVRRTMADIQIIASPQPHHPGRNQEPSSREHALRPLQRPPPRRRLCAARAPGARHRRDLHRHRLQHVPPTLPSPQRRSRDRGQVQCSPAPARTQVDRGRE